MKTTARVHDIREGRAILRCEIQPAACGGCSGGRGCALRWLSGGTGGSLEVAAEASDGGRLARGDDVLVEVADGELLRAAALAYLPPLAGLLAGSVAAGLALPGEEAAAVTLAAIGLGGGWILSRAWLRRHPPRYRVTPGGAP